MIVHVKTIRMFNYDYYVPRHYVFLSLELLLLPYVSHMIFSCKDLSYSVFISNINYYISSISLTFSLGGLVDLTQSTTTMYYYLISMCESI